jgi:hypothetical protein
MRLFALVTATLTLGAGLSHAQGLPPPYAPPVYEAPVAPLAIAPPGYIRAAPLPYDDILLPQEIIGILRSTGFSPLSFPVRRGRFYVLAAVHPDGEDGRVTMDAVTGRFVRFVPNDAITRSMAAYPRPMTAAPRGLRPPMPLPNVASRAQPLPQARPKTAQPATPDAEATATARPPPQASKPGKTAENKVGTDKSAQPVEVKPTFAAPAGPKLLPTQPMPPAQGFD